MWWGVSNFAVAPGVAWSRDGLLLISALGEARVLLPNLETVNHEQNQYFLSPTPK
jgi:hypothetical protein